VKWVVRGVLVYLFIREISRPQDRTKKRGNGREYQGEGKKGGKENGKLIRGRDTGGGGNYEHIEKKKVTFP